MMNGFFTGKLARLVPVIFVSVGAAILTAGCGRNGIQTYTVATNDVTVALPPEANSPAMPNTMSGAMPATMPAGLPTANQAGLPTLNFTTPNGWQEMPATTMRVASFAISQNDRRADVSVIPLGGMAGGDFANVNRWRGQVGLPPLADDDLAKTSQKVEVAGQPAELFDLAGTNEGSGDAARILAVILHRDDTAWFFKVSGDAALVENNKPAFITFLKSVSFGAPTTAPAAGGAMSMSQLPPGHPPLDGMNAATPGAGDAPDWKVPAGWKTAPLEQFLTARYVIAGDGGATAAVNVSSLTGDGGGLLANANRWRAQLGQPPLDDADLAALPAINVHGQPAALVDVSGADPQTGRPARLVGIVLPSGARTWFFKLMGDAGVVAQQKDALIKFVQSAQYPAAQ